jgi:hypothetical protein
VQSDNLAIAPGGAGGLALDNKVIAEVSSHDHHLFRKLVLYPTCHG